MKRRDQYIDKRYGSIVVKRKIKLKSGKNFYLTQCDCGNGVWATKEDFGGVINCICPTRRQPFNPNLPSYDYFEKYFKSVKYERRNQDKAQ